MYPLMTCFGGIPLAQAAVLWTLIKLPSLKLRFFRNADKLLAVKISDTQLSQLLNLSIFWLIQSDLTAI